MFNFYVIININNISNGINKDVKTIDPNNYTKVNNIPSWENNYIINCDVTVTKHKIFSFNLHGVIYSRTIQQ